MSPQHTEPYHAACQQIAGSYVHHVPIFTEGMADGSAMEYTRRALQATGYYIDPEFWDGEAKSCCPPNPGICKGPTDRCASTGPGCPRPSPKRSSRPGGGSHIVPATTGDYAEIAATVTGATGKVFVKAAHTDFGVRSLRFELRVSEAVSGSHSPAVEWHFEAAGWLVVGFEHCEGPHADLSPGSPDLDLLGQALTTLGETPAPEVPWA